MAFFCEKTGARVVAPGISKSAGGIVPEHDGSAAHIAAEMAAEKSLAGARQSPTEAAPSAIAIQSAVLAAIAVLEPAPIAQAPAPASATDPKAPKPNERGKPQA